MTPYEKITPYEENSTQISQASCLTMSLHETINSNEYREICNFMTSHATLLVESMIGGRPISTFRLYDEIKCNEEIGTRSWAISCVEIPCPKAGSYYNSGLEHVEVVIGSSENDMINSLPILESFMLTHPNVKFDTRAISKHVNADVSVDIDGVKVKFHACSLEDVCAYELKMNLVDLVPDNYFC
eukprot:gene4935-9847_t